MQDAVPGLGGETANVEERLRAQVENWRKKLLDLGNRNPLINCAFNPSRGVVEIVHPDCEKVWHKLAADSEAGSETMRFPWRRNLVLPPPDEAKENGTASDDGVETEAPEEWNPPLEECLASGRLRETDLMTEISDKRLDRRLRTLDGYAKLSMSEQGVHCLYVAFGFLKWFESGDSTKELRSPLMLVPVALSRASADAPWELAEAEDDVVDNLCLRQRLKQDFGLELPPLPEIDELEEGDSRLAFLNTVRAAIVENDRWEVEDRCALGRFAFPKVAMWKDLGDHAESVISHALCRSIGGDATVSPQGAFGAGEKIPEASRLDDEVPPGQVKAILDCDSSQLEAIIAARRGISFVLEGPPGTGKSQTISNIIADALAEGRRVLFVSEKVSALEVVKRRLDDCGLGDFCLECHSSKANRKAVLEELSWCLELPVEVYDDTTPKLHEARQKRSELNEYVRAIHRPREPFGLSPYEIYGRVSRLNRLGMATKSRCPLPDTADVDRDTFNTWLHLLSRAKDVRELIACHDSHPWRGCKLTSRSLSLADDLQHHLGVLAEASEKIETATRPLIADGLLSSEITPGRMNDTLKLLRKSLTSPEVPMGWFSNPQSIAKFVLEKHAAENLIDEKQRALVHYVDNVVDGFPDAAAASLVSSSVGRWVDQLTEPLPDGVRRQHDRLVKHAAQLREVVNRAAETETSLTALIEQLLIPVKSDLPIATVPKLVRLARVVVDSGPMRPGWFEPGNWTKVRMFCDVALEKLDAAAASASQIAAHVPPGRLSLFCRRVEGLNTLEAAWELVRRFSRGTKAEDFDLLYQSADEASRILRSIAEAVASLGDALGLTGGTLLSLRSLRSLSELIGPLADTGMLNGTWSDVDARTRMRMVCKAAVSDLREAGEAQEALDERMSHRAFKPSANSLVGRSAAYVSILKRMFGGFGAFRREAVDLYKSSLPDTKTLLMDFARLRTFHRRMADVRESAAELDGLLPDGHALDDCSAWNRVLDAIDALEALTNATPELAAALRPATVKLDRSSLQVDKDRLTAGLASFRIAVEKTPFANMCSDSAILRELVDEFTSIADAAKACREAWEQTVAIIETAPPDFGGLLADVQAAHRYSEALNETAVIFDREQDLMPRGSKATDRVCWERTLAGVEAAERLTGLVRPPEVLRDVLCVEGRIDSTALAVAADTADAAFQKLDDALREVANEIVLSPPDEPPVQPQRRRVTALQLMARAAAEQFENRVRELGHLADVIRLDADASLARLSEDMAAIAEMREAIRRRKEADESLRLSNVDPRRELPDGGYEAAKWLLGLVTSSEISPLMQLVASDNKQRQRVHQIADQIKHAATADFMSSWTFLKSIFDLQADVSFGIKILDTPFGRLAEHFSKLRLEITSLDEWLKFSRWRKDMDESGFGPVVEELLAARYDPLETADVVAVRFYRKLFDHLTDGDATLGDFNIEEHERIRERFRQLDGWEIKAAATRIRQYQLGREDRPRPGWIAPGTSELGILQREAQKKRRHMPLRRLFGEIPGVLQRLKPCIMMSPLSVSTFLQSDEIKFDLVIFDEASQVFPWDAIGAIYRGSQLIVAGDEKQLPPTNFFNRGDMESEEEEDDIGDFESIIRLCKSINMPTKCLRWHYRSRREPLIAFSNRHFYRGELVTFPSVRDASNDSVRLELVREGRWVNRRNIAEAERVAELVIRHHRTQPQTSLGVIAFNSSQQQAIDDVIDRRRKEDPEVDALLNVGLAEPLFIKNLENVQGDERDVILLSMGYAYNEAGKFLKNFGPLTKAGGERRLNVAVTRAREEVVLVASVRAADMDLSDSKSEGSQLLKAYLEYAEHGVDSLARSIDAIAKDCESPFEEEVAAALVRRGFNPVPQVGCGGFRIDFALTHPTRTGEFCLGIECDGATYHSSKTARDRDRIRQSILEGLGWSITRVWSTDWVRNPECQVDRILAAYEVAVSQSDRVDAQSQKRFDDVEKEDKDLQPRYADHALPAKRTFVNIDDVPDSQIRASAKAIIVRAGATDLDDLVKLVARELGFARTGNKIRTRLEAVLNKELHSGSLRWVGERIAARSTAQ